MYWFQLCLIVVFIFSLVAIHGQSFYNSCEEALQLEGLDSLPVFTYTPSEGLNSESENQLCISDNIYASKSKWIRLNIGDMAYLNLAVVSKSNESLYWKLYYSQNAECSSLLSIGNEADTLTNQRFYGDHRRTVPIPFGVTEVIVEISNENSKMIDFDFCIFLSNERIHCDEFYNSSYLFNYEIDVVDRSSSEVLEGPFLPNDTLTVCLFFDYSFANPVYWLHGFIPSFGNGFELINFDSLSTNVRDAIWFPDSTVLTQKYINHFCTYEDVNGFQLCNLLSESCTECDSLFINRGSYLPGGWYFNTESPLLECSNDETPNGSIGISPLVGEVNMCFDIVVNNNPSTHLCLDKKSLSIELQPVTDDMTGCWLSLFYECNMFPKIIENIGEIKRPDPNVSINSTFSDTSMVICSGEPISLDIAHNTEVNGGLKVEVLGDQDIVNGDFQTLTFDSSLATWENSFVNTSSNIASIEVLVMSDQFDCSCEEDTTMIQLQILPQSIAQDTSISFCAGEGYLFDLDIADESAQIEWMVDIPDFIYSEDGNQLIIMEDNGPGDYIVSATIIQEYEGVECSEMVSLNIDILEDYDITINETLCPDESIIIHGTLYDQSNPLGTEFLTAQNGCDSILHVEIFFHPENRSELDITLCNDETIFVEGYEYGTLSIDTTILSTTLSSQGCDSIIDLSVTVLPEAIAEVDSTICQGESIDFEGMSYDEAGTYNFNFPVLTDNGCDSIIMLTVAIYDSLAIGSDIISDTGSGNGLIRLDIDESQVSDIIWSTGDQGIYELSGLNFGDYEVMIMDINGCSYSLTFTVPLESSLDDSVLSNVGVYPNPFQEILYIGMENTKEYHFKVYNQNSILISSGQIIDNSIDLKSLLSGLYFIEIIDPKAEDKQVFKIVKL